MKHMQTYKYSKNHIYILYIKDVLLNTATCLPELQNGTSLMIVPLAECQPGKHPGVFM